MKKNYLLLVLLLLFSFFKGYTQQLRQVTFSSGSNFSWFTFSTNQNVLIRMADDGTILEFGTEEQALNNRNYFAPKLRPFEGRVEYFSNNSDSAFRGKIRSIGTCYFTYFPSNDYPDKVGKIRTAGSLLFDYYRKFDDASIAGKIKNIGSDEIGYYGSFESDEVLKGKLKRVGRTSIVYYSSFDDKSIRGKIKSIGSAQFVWYSSFERAAGSMKSGLRRQPVNGVTYVLE